MMLFSHLQNRSTMTLNAFIQKYPQKTSQSIVYLTFEGILASNNLNAWYQHVAQVGQCWILILQSLKQLNKMFKVLAVLCLLGTAAICASSKANANAIKVPPPPALDPTSPAADVLAEVNAFKQWKDLYGKKFDTEEDKFRFLTFVKNRNLIKAHNGNDKKKFTMDTNQFAAETPEEFAAKHLGGKPHDQAYLDKIKLLKEGEIMTPIKIPSLEEIQALIEKQKNATATASASASPLPAQTVPAPTISLTLPNPNANPNSIKVRNLQVVPPAVPPPINWATLGKVSPIRDQGNCGSCYAFSTVAGVESAYLVDHNQTVGLSEQQLVDCSIFLGNYGCQGGWTDYTLNYIIYFNITSRSSYPYLDAQGNCKEVGGDYHLRTYTFSEGCSGLLNDIQKRPVVVAVDGQAWQLYQSGVLNSCQPSGWDRLNHAALLVGIDSNQNWILKNSWGNYWGENGFITIQAGEMCSICVFPGVVPYL